MAHFINYFYKDTCYISDNKLSHYTQQLAPIVAQLQNNMYQYDMSTPYAWVNLPTNKEYVTYCKQLITEKKKLNPDVLVLIGIGGSDLGTRAIYQAARTYTDHETIALYTIDTIEERYTQEALAYIEHNYLKRNKKIIINIVSKSGTTLETVVNAALFYDLLKKYQPQNTQEYIVITTDKDSPLYVLAIKNNFSVLEIPRNIGGRYSVFSAVGLFPLGMLNVNLDNLLHGAAAACEESCHASTRAAILYAYYQQNIMIHDIFIFNPRLAYFGAWYRQLIAESLGKNGTGFLPTVSLGSVDLHSVIQLYLGGQRIRLTTFITYKDNNLSHNIPNNDFSSLILSHPATIAHVHNSLFQSITHVYKQEKLPYMAISCNANIEYAMGYIMQIAMLETVCLAYLMKVNPFDQPEVELYKKEVKYYL